MPVLDRLPNKMRKAGRKVRTAYRMMRHGNQRAIAAEKRSKELERAIEQYRLKLNRAPTFAERNQLRKALFNVIGPSAARPVQPKPAEDQYAEIDFGELQLGIHKSDPGGRQYNDPSYWGELIDPIHREIIERFHPALYVDIGANYGFTALVHHTLNPTARIIAVEAMPLLQHYLAENLKKNGCPNFEVVHAVCGAADEGEVIFSINPAGSQDNRVLPVSDAWDQVRVPQRSVAGLLFDVPKSDFVFFKIDVQGYERSVFAGAEPFLRERTNWVVKTEFAPFCLRSQQTDPVELLTNLLERYVVIELPKRTRFKGERIDQLMQSRLTPDDAAPFVSYLDRLARRRGKETLDNTGWCDLLVLPQ